MIADMNHDRDIFVTRVPPHGNYFGISFSTRILSAVTKSVKKRVAL